MRKARKLDVACPNKDCIAYNKVGLRNIVRNGKQPNGTQKYKCTDCGRNFVRTINTPFFHKHLKKKEIIRICKLLVERISFRGIARATDHHLDTIRSVADVVAKHCKKFNDYFIQELKLTPIEVDEMWSFVKKNKKVAKRSFSKTTKRAMLTPT
jgi:transposase-like protein